MSNYLVECRRLLARVGGIGIGAAISLRRQAALARAASFASTRLLAAGAAMLAGFAWPAESAAAVPDVKHLFPAGGAVGQSFEVEVEGKLSQGTDWRCSQPGVSIDVADDPQKIKVTLADDARPGLCWLRFFNAEGACSARPLIIGTLPEAIENEPNGAIAEAHKLESPRVVVNGRLLRNGDVDTFAIELKEGQTLVAAMEANRHLGSPMDGVLQIVSADGFVLEQNDDWSGRDPQIVFAVKKDGTYLVRAFAFPAEPNSSVRFSGGKNYIYRLTLTTGPFLDCAMPLAVSRGASHKVQLKGWNIADDFTDFPIDASDDQHAFALVHDPRVANTTQVKIEPHPAICEHEMDEQQRQAIKLPITITGVIGKPQELDVYHVSAQKGDKLAFRIESRAWGHPLDPVLRLLDSQGKTIRAAETRSSTLIDEVLAQTIPSAGMYQLQVADLHGRGGSRFVYCLTADYERTDFALAVASDVFTLTPGKALEIPVSVDRKNRFAAEIEIQAVGLPPGVIAAPLVSKAKGRNRSESLKLVLNSKEPPPFSGPVRIVGRSKEKAPIERTAQVSVPGLDAKFSEIWLTVLPAKEE